jgi:hypothetical protein
VDEGFLKSVERFLEGRAAAQVQRG